MLRKNYGKHLGIDRENRFFPYEVTFPNLRHPQLFIKDEFLELKDGISLQFSKQYCRLVLLLPNVKSARRA